MGTSLWWYHVWCCALLRSIFDGFCLYIRPDLNSSKARYLTVSEMNNFHVRFVVFIPLTLVSDLILGVERR